MSSPVRTLGLVGCGHIGGSLAAALRADGVRVVACDAKNAERARELGLVDEIVATPEEVAARAELTVLAAPVGVIAGLAGHLPGLVTDVGSLKSEIVRAGSPRFVGGHPMAGSEKSGPDAADDRLFARRTVILTPRQDTDPGAVKLVEALWTQVGARVVHMTAEAHDVAIAAVSQLPHVAAYALAAVVGRSPELAGLGGGSLQSGTRVAASDVELWTELLTRNHAALLPWIDAFVARVGELRAALALGDAAGLHELLGDGQRGRTTVLP